MVVGGGAECTCAARTQPFELGGQGARRGTERGRGRCCWRLVLAEGNAENWRFIPFFMLIFVLAEIVILSLQNLALLRLEMIYERFDRNRSSILLLELKELDQVLNSSAIALLGRPLLQFEARHVELREMIRSPTEQRAQGFVCFGRRPRRHGHRGRQHSRSRDE